MKWYNEWFFLKLNRALAGRGRYQLMWLMAAIFAALAVIYALSLLVSSELGIWDRLYTIIGLFVDPGQMSSLPANHRWFELGVAISGVILFCGLLISVLSNIIERRLERFRNGELTCKMSGHTVIIGYQEMVPSIIRHILDNPKEEKRYVLLQSSRSIPEVRSILRNELSREQEKRVLLISGNRTSYEDLKKQLSVQDADRIFIIGEDEESERDSQNIACVKRIAEILGEKCTCCEHRSASTDPEKAHCKECERNAKPITVLFEHQTSFAIFKAAELSNRWNRLFNLRAVNLHEDWARRVLVYRTYSPEGNVRIAGIDEKPGKRFRTSRIDAGQGDEIIYPHLDREPIPYESDKYVHFIIFGMTRMGIAMGVEAAHRLHFPNFCRDNKLKSVITFIDEDADREMDYFKGRYHHLFDLSRSEYYEEREGVLEKRVLPPGNSGTEEMLDIEFRFVKGSGEKPAVRKQIEEWVGKKHAIVTIAVCLRAPHKAAAMGLYLPDIVYDKAIPVLIRQRSSGALLSMISDSRNSNKYTEIYPFGMLNNCYYDDGYYIEMAKGINYLHSWKYDTFAAMKREDPSLDDKAAIGLRPKGFPHSTDIRSIDEKWNKLSLRSRWSSLYCAYSLPVRLRSAGIAPTKELQEKWRETLKASVDGRTFESLYAEVEHNRWNVEKLLFGYRMWNEKDFSRLAELQDNSKELDAYLKEMKEVRMAHRDIVPYAALPGVSRDNDVMIVENIPAFMEREKEMA